MKKFSLATQFLGAAIVSLPLAALPLHAHAQNVATVNGKAVPKSRVDTLIDSVKQQAAARNQAPPPNLDVLARDKVVMDEIFSQEAEKKGIPASAEFKGQMEAARQGLLVQDLFANSEKNVKVSDADVAAEYDRYKAQASGTEYRARHILVENEDQAKALIAQINGGAKFEDVAKKNSKDTGSAENGGDLDFANPKSYVPEFSEALVKLKKGEMTQVPVKSQFGYHIIRLEDTREAKFPTLEEVKPQIVARLTQQKVIEYRDDLRAKAKTDYKFSQ
jgi:peptidyl-prolyl cis-trans isomerase C